MRHTHFVSRFACATGALLMTGFSMSIFERPGVGVHAISAAQASALESTQVGRGRYLVKIAGCNDCHTPGYAQASGKTPESQWLIGDRLGWQVRGARLMRAIFGGSCMA